MNFKTLALATTLAITGLVTGTSAQAMAMCADVVDKGYAGTCFGPNGNAFDNAQAWAAGSGNVNTVVANANDSWRNGPTRQYSAQTEALFSAMTGGGNYGRTYTFAEAKKYCLAQDSYNPRPEYDTFTGEATGYWECGHGNGTSGGRIRMAN